MGLNFLEIPPNYSKCQAMNRVTGMLGSHHQEKALEQIIKRSDFQNHSDVRQLIVPPLASNSSTSTLRKFLLVRSLSHICSPNSSKEFRDLALW